jgi:hypothetical protein
LMPNGEGIYLSMCGTMNFELHVFGYSKFVCV